MKRSQLIVTALLLSLLLLTALANRAPVSYGAVPARGWVALALFTAFLGVAWAVFDAKRMRRQIAAPLAVADAGEPHAAKAPSTVVALDPDGPSYPHPVINVATCIGCHACVDACPHDVLAIVNGKAAPVALEQCMEDTSCQVECPTVPKSCIVVNTNKQIPKRKVPQRDNRFLTNVPGVYLIGDVSGVPLIKNAINEGGAVIDYICEDLRSFPKSNQNGGYDVAIIGIGPAGLSATARAAERGLKYVALEQDQVVATIQQTYQAGKYVYFNPVDQAVKGGITLDGAGAAKEAMIAAWMQTVAERKLVIHEYESCKRIQPVKDAADNGSFLITTEQDKAKASAEYRARRVVLAIGNRGTPMRLKVPGEELKVTITPTEATLPTFCNKCGTPRVNGDKFCQRCGSPYVARVRAPYEDEKVKYRLSDPNAYRGKHVLVVGAGNSAVEAAIDLAAYRSEDGTQIAGWRDNTVSLLIRSNFKGDLKLGNKMLVYEAIDEGRITAHFGQTVKEIAPTEVALMSARERDPQTAKETARFPNDYIFALIGGEKPTKFLEEIGIKIG